MQDFAWAEGIIEREQMIDRLEREDNIRYSQIDIEEILDENVEEDDDYMWGDDDRGADDYDDEDPWIYD